MEALQERKYTKEGYNAVPVHYCPHCLSLRVMIMNDYIDYCGICGCTDIKTTSIEEWQKMYNERFSTKL